LFNIMTKGALYYARTARDPDIVARYGHGAPNDWLETRLYAKHVWLGISVMAAFDVAAFGAVPGLAVWVIQMLWIPFWAAGVINGVGHFAGYRNADSLDASTNISPWGIIIGGEELHNNHHLYPTSAKLSVKPFEFDIGWAYLRILSAMGLVTIKKTAPVWRKPANPSFAPNLDDFITHRFEILAQYSRHLKRLYRLELSVGGTSLRLRFGFWKYLDTLRLRPECSAKLATLRSGSGALAKALELREELVSIWTNRQASKEQSQQALSAWIARVEASGIQELQKFVAKLRRLPREAGA
jgi:stearoyl-CoA desaturase (delta-9 desaturase)